ncbi:aminoglycoside phosphotransferase family protein [Pseudoalteromonas sp. McH1-42]|uniref:aminoglycoside phosphotransferase family protein n=1 Tax=Pseudoalteromonas sp. McH1-42 TaxID=2917752 RepID=UPI001EF6BD5C|nr:aminoglycoside phosphotransferase family protein [Pseudoalteromonas sp. McH1-42]MCG7563593.1 aminoglycoside phosphotransferase family protein [Pseudoalteromonas sp. McH1-42]
MINDAVRHWLEDVLGTENFTIASLNGGANNRGYEIVSKGTSWFLKSFSPNHTQSGHKLANEFGFSQYLWQNGVTSVPEPIACNAQAYVSLFSFIQGDPVTEAKPGSVKEALQFLEHINAISQPRAHLNIASESPDSLYGFYSIIEKRLARFQPQQDNRALKTLLQQIQTRANKLLCHLPAGAKTTQTREVLSPSDFGFHNALQTSQGVVFFDFEYAGIDTSWKLLCDFFSQPAVPVDLTSLDIFFASRLFEHVPSQKDTFLTILELTQLKWCLIMLNEFIGDVQSRRQFSWNKNCLKPSELEEIKVMQLIKSQKYFASIASNIESAASLCD